MVRRVTLTPAVICVLSSSHLKRSAETRLSISQKRWYKHRNGLVPCNADSDDERHGTATAFSRKRSDGAFMVLEVG